jgi:hypothetical protein
MSQLKALSQNKTKLIVDLVIFLGFLVAMQPHMTGLAVHEWLTLAAIAAIITHLLLSWQWIAEITTRFFKSMPARTRINYLLNLLLFIDVTLVMFTGIMISEHAMPLLGINLGHNMLWRRLHSVTADLFVPILGLHTALHWGWIVTTMKRYFFQPVMNLFARKHSNIKSQEA